MSRSWLDLRIAIAWGVAAILLWLAAAALELRTPLEIYSDGGQVWWTVADSTLVAPVAISEVRRITITAKDAVFAPGGRFIEVSCNNSELLREPLPTRFAIPPGEVAPVGDWEIDERAGEAVVYTRDLEAAGPLTLRAELRGRFLAAVTITLEGDFITSFQLRRGLINNDLFILDHDGETIAATSIDPHPVGDSAAAAATLLAAAAVASLMLAAATALGAAWRGRSAATFGVPPPGRLPLWVVLSLLAAVSAGTSAWVASQVLERLPHQPDGVTYLLQASWLLDGQLSQPEPPNADHIDPPFTRISNGRWVAHYPAGWPALLAVGLALGRPWLVAPLLAAAYTLLIFAVGRELFGPWVALAGAVLAVVSPFSTVIFASHLSHAASSNAILLFLWLLLVAQRRYATWPGFAAGISLGYAFGVRPLTSVAVMVVGGLLLLHWVHTGKSRRRSLTVVAAVLAGGVLATLPTLVHNLLTTGHPLSFPYTLVKGTMYGIRNLPFGLRNLDAILAYTAPQLYGWGWPRVGGWVLTALPLAFAWLPLLRRRPDSRDLFLLALYVAVATAHIGAQASGLHGFGPRYHFEAFFALYLLSARGFERLAAGAARSPTGRLATGSSLLVPTIVLFLALNLSTCITLRQRFELYRDYNQVTGCLEEQIGDLGLEDGLVLFVEQDWRNWAEAIRHDITDPDARVVFATAGEDPEDLLAYYDDRPTYTWDGYQLVPLPVHQDDSE